MTKRRLTTALSSLLVAAALPAAANAYPSTNPAQVFAPGTTSIKSDQTMTLSFNGLQYRSNGLGSGAQIHAGTGGQWVVTRSTASGRDHRETVNAGPVAIYSRNAGAYLVRRVAASGPVVGFSARPSLQWRVERRINEGRLRLFNTIQNDYLVQGFPGIDDVSLNWRSRIQALTRTSYQRIAATRHILPADGTYFEGRTTAFDGVVATLTNTSRSAVRVLPLGAPGEDCLKPYAGITMAGHAGASRDQLNTLGLLYRSARSPITLRACSPFGPTQLVFDVGLQNTTPQ